MVLRTGPPGPGQEAFRTEAGPGPGVTAGIGSLQTAVVPAPDTFPDWHLCFRTLDRVPGPSHSLRPVFLGPAQRDLGTNRPVRSLTDELPSV